MIARARRGWLLPLVPILLAAVGVGLLALLPGGVPILRLGIDLATLAAILGLALAVLTAAGVALWAWGRRAGLAAARRDAATDRRHFLRRLDHELKNPLMAIRAAAANLPPPTEAADRAGPGVDLSPIGGSIAAQATRLSRLAADLRKLADLETAELERMPVDPGDLLREVVSLAAERPETAERRLTVTVPSAPWPLPTIIGDRDLLFLALYNLLDNAIKFSAPGDTIEVRAFEDSARVIVEVADTGPGLPDEEIPFVWDELYRGQTARAVGGSGLGLALVRAIVARHGGQVALRSRLGDGTVVTLRLPTG